MSYQNLTLNEIDYYLGGREITPRPVGVGIFQDCEGELTGLKYLGEDITRGELESLVLDNLLLCESAFETIEIFKWRWRNTWNRHFPLLKSQLATAPDITLEETKADIVTEYGENTTANGTSTNTAELTDTATMSADKRFSNTPNQLVDNTFEGLTTLNKDAGTNERTANGSGTTTSEQTGNRKGNRTITDTRSNNAFLKWLEVSDANRNILYEFCEKFDELFTKTTVIRNYNRDYFYKRGIKI